MAWRGLIEEYRKYLPVSEKTPVITLHEGNTPLIRARNLEEHINPKIEIYLKFEGMNPTGSFKDRGMTMAISKAVEDGANAVICASTGNTSAAASAYSARAGLKSFVLIPEGKIAMGKLAQAIMHGAVVVQIDGNFDEALNIVRQVSEKYPITMVNSLNPYRIEGQKTAAFEICDAMGEAPTFHILPVGNAGNITAYWKGYKEYKAEGKTKTLPRMLGFQAEGSAPIVLGKPIKNPETVATAIRIGNPASWKEALAARDESKGLIDMVSDEEILRAYRLVAVQEGVFCEPASAASIAGLMKANHKRLFTAGDKVVCTLTGHGLKDPDNALKVAVQSLKCKATMEDVVRVLGY